jgi:hypothetical protein
MNSFKQFPFYCFLIPLFFCMHGLAEHYHFLSFAEAFSVFKWVMLGVLICFSLFFVFTKNICYSGFATSIILTAYIYFGNIKNAVSAVPFIKKYSYFIPVLSIAVIFILYVVKKRNVLIQKLTLYLNVLLLLYIIIDVFVIFKKSNEKIQLAPIPFEFEKAKVISKPNFYLLVFDEYAGLQNLATNFGYNNSKFYDSLKQIGFNITNTKSNYNYTPVSMASMLNAQFIPTLKDSGTLDWKQEQHCAALIRNAQVFEVFKKLDYNINSYSLFEVGNNKHVSISKFLLGHEKILTHKMLHYDLLKKFGYLLLKVKPFDKAVQNLFLYEFYNYNDVVEQKLFSEIKEKRSNPQMTYAHFLMPHYPFLYDSNSVKKPIDVLFNEEHWVKSDNYLSYLKHSNKKILEFAKKIATADSNAVIVLISDHGYRDPNPHNSLNFDNFCAIYAKQSSGWQNNTISNVNLFPLLFNQTFQQNIPYKPDSTIRLRETIKW